MPKRDECVCVLENCLTNHQTSFYCTNILSYLYLYQVVFEQYQAEFHNKYFYLLLFLLVIAMKWKNVYSKPKWCQYVY